MNRDAIGSLVRITDSNGQAQIRQIMSGGSRGAGNQISAHFGLGDATLESVEILWPQGQRHSLSGLPVNQRHEVGFSDLDRIMADSFE